MTLSKTVKSRVFGFLKKKRRKCILEL